MSTSYCLIKRVWRTRLFKRDGIRVQEGNEVEVLADEEKRVKRNPMVIFIDDEEESRFSSPR